MELIKILLILGIMSMGLSGCKDSGDSGAPGAGSGSGPGIEGPETAPTEVLIQIRSGRNFSCFAVDAGLRGHLYCLGHNATMGLDSDNFVLYVKSIAPIFDFHVRDDSLCYETIVQSKPYSRSPGVATYCHGEASLSVSYASFPIVYSGPPYSSESNGSPSLYQLNVPFAGGDISLKTLVEQTSVVPEILTDGIGQTSEETIVCTKFNGLLTCPTFNLNVGE